MTRKRFIKLMMAHGYSRNFAAAQAMYVSQYGSYKAMYQQISPGLIGQALSSAIHRGFKGLAVICEAAAAVFSGFAASMRRAAHE